MAAASVADSKSDDEHPAPIARTNSEEKGSSHDAGGMEQYYMSGPKLGVLMTGLCIALYLLGLDTSIVATVCIANFYIRSTDELELMELTGDSENYRAVRFDHRHRLVR